MAKGFEQDGGEQAGGREDEAGDGGSGGDEARSNDGDQAQGDQRKAQGEAGLAKPWRGAERGDFRGVGGNLPGHHALDHGMRAVAEPVEAEHLKRGAKEQAESEAGAETREAGEWDEDRGDPAPAKD